MQLSVGLNLGWMTLQ